VVQYTAQGDPYLHLIRRYAKDNAPQIISLNEGHDLAALEALRALRRGEVVALKGDRVIDEHTAEVSLLGGRVAVPTGPYLLAALSDSPLFLLGCFKEDATTYRVIASEPLVLSFRSRATRAEDLQQWAQRFADQMEEWARRYPLQWYNTISGAILGLRHYRRLPFPDASQRLSLPLSSSRSSSTQRDWALHSSRNSTRMCHVARSNGTSLGWSRLDD